jgi:hypothetical protein
MDMYVSPFPRKEMNVMATNRPRGLLVAAAVAIAVMAVGCSENPTSPVINSEINQQQAEQMAGQLAASMAANGGWVMTELRTAASSATAAGAGATPPAGSQVLSSTADEITFSEGNLNFSFSYQFFNLDDQPLAGWDTTAVKLVAASRVWGTATEPEVVLTVGHAAELIFTGVELSTDILTLNGAANDTLGADFNNPDSSGVRTLDWLASLGYADVRMHKDEAVNPYPLSGTATYYVNAEDVFVAPEGDVTAGYNATAVIRFNGTQYPEIAIDGRYFYRTNLVTGEVIPL